VTGRTRERIWSLARALACAAAGALLVGCSSRSEPIEIANAWVAATPPNATVAAAYMDIVAHGSDRLLRASSPLAQQVEIHQTLVEDGVSKMRPISELALAEGETVKLEPGGTHLMMIGIASAFATGQTVPLSLEFERAGTIELDVPVMTHGTAPHGSDHSHH